MAHGPSGGALTTPTRAQGKGRPGRMRRTTDHAPGTAVGPS